MSHDERIINHERRLEQVEREVNLLVHQATLTTDLIKRLEVQTVKQDEITRRLEIALARKGDCPDPGACLRLRTEVDAVIEQLTELKLDRSKLLGIFIVISALATMVFGPLVKWIFDLLKP